MTRRLLLTLAVLLALTLTTAPDLDRPATAQTTPAVRVIAVGDISPPPSENKTDDMATAAIAVGWNPSRILAAGDLQYELGQLENFRHPQGYAASWGRPQLYNRTCPVAGNHEYMNPSPGAPGFFTYFGPRLTACATSGNPGQGYYAFDLNGWRIYALSSDCGRSGKGGPACGPGSPQLNWFIADLAANPRTCTLAFWHHPRWGSGFFNSHTHMAPAWEAFHARHGDLVVVGHEHHYSRFGPLNAAGTVQGTNNGTRQILIGTGGRSLGAYRVQPHPSGLRVRDNTHYGVLRLTLTPTTWASAFARTDGVVADPTGTVGCWP
jgi:calcineurin-like phosphoesterase family protein